MTANTRPKLAMLEPTTFPKAKSGKPSKAAFILTINSGAEVAKDTTVIPITIFGMASLSDKSTAAFNNQLPPTISNRSPRIIKRPFTMIHGIYDKNM